MGGGVVLECMILKGVSMLWPYLCKWNKGGNSVISLLVPQSLLGRRSTPKYNA